MVELSFNTGYKFGSEINIPLKYRLAEVKNQERNRILEKIEGKLKEARHILEKSPQNFSAMGAIAVLSDLQDIIRHD